MNHPVASIACVEGTWQGGVIYPRQDSAARATNVRHPPRHGAAMKTTSLFAVLLIAMSGAAQALDVKSFSPQALSAAQQAGKRVALHFHAPWCPTCRAQEGVFKDWRGDASVPGTLLVVDYDNARELRRQLAVRGQSTLIVYQGAKEVARVAGVTDADALRTTLTAAH
jgi:thiol:disulfide interchange protein